MDPAFFLLHRDLPREGPGSDATTREALRRLPPLRRDARVLDLGCGPGRQTLVLAQALPEAHVVAVDLHEPFLAQLSRDAAAAGLAGRIEARRADFGRPEALPGGVDLVWSEGAVYLLGFAEGLRRWRGLLREGGLMALSEAVWLSATPPPEVRAFWKAYPQLTSVEENVRVAGAQGLEVLDTFVLPPACWWEYYGPLERRIEALRPGAPAGSALAAVLDEAQQEVEMYRRHGDTYGYAFFLLRRG